MLYELRLRRIYNFLSEMIFCNLFFLSFLRLFLYNRVIFTKIGESNEILTIINYLMKCRKFSIFEIYFSKSENKI